MTALMIAIVTCLLPIIPRSEPLALRPLLLTVFLGIGFIDALYIGAAEMAKRLFYKRISL